MSGVKFTIGKTNVEAKYYESYGLYLDFYDKEENLIAEICLYEDDDKNKANAALLTAAPEMYAELAHIEDILEDSEDCGEISLDRIKSILHKARGESEIQ